MTIGLEPNLEETTSIVFSNEEINIYGEDLEVEGTTVVIEKPGSFLVTGESEEGNIVIKSSSVTLYLEDLFLTSEKTAPIIITSNLKDVQIINLRNTTLNDFENSTSTEGECAVIKIKKNSIVSFKNEETLELNGICKDAIKGGSKTTLIFEVSNGEYIINSRKVAIDSDGLLEFKGGKFTIESERGDAIKSSPMDSDKGSLGMIMINDGDFKIRCFNDAFTAKNNIVIKDGKFDIITETGSGSKTFNKEKGSAKGFKSTSNETGCGIYIYSGEFTIDSADDSIHSNRDLTILAGKYNISSKDDGIVAKWHLILGKKNDPNEKLQITINKSYEAIEGMTITIFSGKIRCKSKDDGMNASHDKQEEIDKDNAKRNQQRNNTNQRNNTGGNDPNWTWPNNRNGSNWTFPGGQNWTFPGGQNWTFPGGQNWTFPNGQNWTFPNNQNWTFPNNRNNSGGRGGGNRMDDISYWDEVRRTHVSGPPNPRYIIRIYNGDIYIETDSDGIDSNGNLYIHGGNINVYSVGTGANEPIDLSGNFTLFNAEVLSVGAGGVQFAHVALKKGNQMYAFYSGNVKKDQKLLIKDESGKVVKEGSITKNINYIFYSSILLNEYYRFYIVGEDKKENELIFEFGYPEKGLDDQDKYEIDDEKTNSVENKKENEIDEESEDYSKYLKIMMLGIYLLLL
jgi:hypothetical protein